MRACLYHAQDVSPLRCCKHPGGLSLHRLLMDRADALMGCTEYRPEEAELVALTDVIEAYGRQRWPLGRIPGGNG